MRSMRRGGSLGLPQHLAPQRLAVTPQGAAGVQLAAQTVTATTAGALDMLSQNVIFQEEARSVDTEVTEGTADAADAVDEVVLEDKAEAEAVVLEALGVVAGEATLLVGLPTLALLMSQHKETLLPIWLESMGHPILFWKGCCTIFQDAVGGDVAAMGIRENNLYKLQVELPNKPSQPLPSGETVLAAQDTKLWHLRTGHLGGDNLKLLPNMVTGMSNIGKGEVGFCDTCHEAKIVPLPHNGTRVQSTRPLERVHSDLCGPIIPTYNGTKYFMTIIDDFTHFTVVFNLQTKSQEEVHSYISMYEASVTARFQTKISKFRCDNGREYDNNLLRNFFKEKGIEFECNIPHTPQNNGVAERMNRTILDRARAMLLGCCLNDKFWFDAVASAVYIINRSPTSCLKDKVPAELWFGRKPNLQKLRVFGCVAIVCKPQRQINGKFDAKGKKAIMLGYCDNGYRLWSFKDQRVITACDVKFDESRFRFERPSWIYKDG